LRCLTDSISIDRTLFCALSKVFRETLMHNPDMDYELFLDDYSIDIVQDLVKLCYFGEIDKYLEDDRIVEIQTIAKALGIVFNLEKVVSNDADETSTETDSTDIYDQEELKSKITTNSVRILIFLYMSFKHATASRAVEAIKH